MVKVFSMLADVGLRILAWVTQAVLAQIGVAVNGLGTIRKLTQGTQCKDLFPWGADDRLGSVSHSST